MHLTPPIGSRSGADLSFLISADFPERRFVDRDGTSPGCRLHANVDCFRMAKRLEGHIPVVVLPRRSRKLSGSDSVLPNGDRVQRRSARRTKDPNIPHRWLAEETTVLAIELACTFVSDLKGRTCGVQTVDEHASPRCLQAKLLLILKRTHCC